MEVVAGAMVGVEAVCLGEKPNRVAKRPEGWRSVGLWMDDWQSRSVVVLEGDVSV